MVIISEEANEPPEPPSGSRTGNSSNSNLCDNRSPHVDGPGIPADLPVAHTRVDDSLVLALAEKQPWSTHRTANQSVDVKSLASSRSSISSHSSTFASRNLPPYTSAEGSNTVIGIDELVGDSPPYATPAAVVAASLGTHLQRGLSSQDAQQRLERYGPNRLESKGGVSVWGVLLRQVSNSLTLVLVIAMCLAYGTSDFIEGGVISSVILLNIVVGFVQDYKAEKTMNSLQSLSAPVATVIRDGNVIQIKSEELVLGDIVRLSVGDTVPADVRLFDGMNFEANEALLTGESLPVAKDPEATYANVEISVSDRHNMAFASSTVSKGRATAIVVATGMDTEVGTIATLLRGGGNDDSKKGNALARGWRKFKSGGKNVLGLVGTPLQIKLSKFAILLFGMAIMLAIIVFSANKWKIDNEVLIYGICVAVAVIPESLIAVLTITMSVGTKTMAKGNVVVRKMQALEAVGGVTNICSDKTGTLTQGKMIARMADVAGFGNLTVEDSTHPFDPTSGSIKHEDTPIVANREFANSNGNLSNFLIALALCNLSLVSKREASVKDEKNSTSTPSTDEGTWTAVGEPTEISLHVLAMRFGMGKQDILATGQWSQLAEHAFDSTVKRMSVVYQNSKSGDREAFMKGAADVVIPILAISDEEKEALLRKTEEMAGQGLRVLCIAKKTLSPSTKHEIRAAVEINMEYLGLVGMYDPPRAETRDAVRKCRVAGVKVHMLTGDHIRTATAIAHEVGILPKAIPSALANSIVMSATHFDSLSDDEVDKLEELPLVIARCSPRTKVRMVEALHRRKAFCVMTGDGVNDSPALKHADVGIAMGITGSDVAKDAADMVLTDDNFASIVRAVEEGRRLFDNIQKFIVHLLISNIAQVVLLLIGLAFRDNAGVSVFPLSPLEILWVNMITSSFLALGLGLEEAQPDIMLRPPHDLRQGIFTWEVITDKMIYGVTMGALCLVSFVSVIYVFGDGNLATKCNNDFTPVCNDVYRARATVFAVLSFLLLVTAWEVKHFSRSIFNLDPTRHKGPLSVFKAVYYNKFLFWAVVAGFVITFPVIYLPTVNKVVFHHVGITWEWGIVMVALVVYVAVIEAWKGIKRHFGIWSGALKIVTIEEAEARLEEGWEST